MKEETERLNERENKLQALYANLLHERDSLYHVVQSAIQAQELAAQAAAAQAAEEQARAALAAESSIGPMPEPEENGIQTVEGSIVETVAKPLPQEQEALAIFPELPQEQEAVAIFQEPPTAPPATLAPKQEELPSASVAVVTPAVEND